MAVPNSPPPHLMTWPIKKSLIKSLIKRLCRKITLWDVIVNATNVHPDDIQKEVSTAANQYFRDITLNVRM